MMHYMFLFSFAFAFILISVLVLDYNQFATPILKITCKIAYELKILLYDGVYFF